jgi:hypothetical protein
MADTLRIKRRTGGAPGAPVSLANAELAYNEVDHVLYYGEGTGGGGGSATVVVPVGGAGQSATANPAMDGTASAGSSTLWARGDHVHPTDTSRAPTASPTLTGTVTIPTVTPATDNTTKAASTAFVQSAISAVSSGVTNITAGTGLSGGGTGVVTLNIATNGVTNALMAQMPTLTLKGNNTGGTANALDLTAAQTMTMLGAAPLASPSFTGTPTTATTPTNGDNTTKLATTAFVLATRLDQLTAPTVNVSMNSKNITSLLDPVNPQDGATKNYVDNTAQGLDAKASVKAASAGSNLTLSGTQTVDGVALIASDRILVKDQTTTANNGLYVVAAGAWARATDMDTWAEVPGSFVFVEQGTTNADTGWVSTADQGGTLNTTPITWTQFSGAGQVIAGAGLTKTGNSIDVIGTASRILVNADNIDIDSGYVGQASITTLGTVATGTWNATTITVAKGGTGAATLTGYVKGAGTSALTALAQIPNTDITGLGTMSTQAASAVAITGGTIDGVTFDCGTF